MAQETINTRNDMNETVNEIDQHALPRCPLHDGSTLKIARAYTEAGYFEEANAVTITDGTRAAVYVPAKVLPDAAGLLTENPFPAAEVIAFVSTIVAVVGWLVAILG